MRKISLIISTLLFVALVILINTTEEEDHKTPQNQVPSNNQKHFTHEFSTSTNFTSISDEKVEGRTKIKAPVSNPEILTDQEIRIIRERIDRQYGGKYYYYTPGRHVQPIEEVVSEKTKDANWAEENIR